MVNARNGFVSLRNPDDNAVIQPSMPLKNIPKFALGPVLWLSLLNVSYAAEDTVRGSTAATHPHPELSPTGIQKGGFIFLPSFLYSLTHDDNIFATENDKESSLVSTFSPSVSAISNWNNHALSFSAASTIGKNHDFSSEDFTDWNVSTDGSLDIRHDIKLQAGLGFGHEHVARDAPDETRGVEPTEFDRSSFFTRYSQKFGRITASVDLNLIEKKYEDVEAIRLGVPVTIDNSVRDRTESRIGIRAGYNYVGNQQVFVSIRDFDRDYDKAPAFGGLEKSSTGLESTIGASFDYHGIFLGEVSLGYRSQDYEQPLPDIETPVARAAIRWNISDLTTAGFSLDQTIQESISQISSGYTSKIATINLDHELKRDLLLFLSFQFTRDNFESIDPVGRDDKSLYVIAGSSYKMNRNLHFDIQYVYSDRESDFSIASFDTSLFEYSKNLITFTILTHF